MRSNKNINQSRILGINASRARSGGAKSHLIGILNSIDKPGHQIDRVHVWSYSELLNQLVNKDWITKHIVSSKNILNEVFWEAFTLPKKMVENKCTIALNIDSGSFNRFYPFISMSRDMLSYEPGIMRKYGLSISRLRLIVLKYVQNSTLRSSNGSIFLTKYASKTIQKSAGKLNEFILIPHGVDESFRFKPREKKVLKNNKRIKCIYVSNAAPYKHQNEVVKAVSILKRKYPNIHLTLTGGGLAGRGNKENDKLLNTIQHHDPERKFIKLLGYIDHSKLPSVLKSADIFIFASSCENMPNTLLEGMSAGLPIACSDRGPMPEILKEYGVYFNPEDYNSIALSIDKLIFDDEFRNQIAKKSFHHAKNFSWEKCSNSTFKYISKVHRKYYEN